MVRSIEEKAETWRKTRNKSKITKEETCSPQFWRQVGDVPYPHAASQHRENVGVEFPDSHEPYFGSGSFSRPEAGLTNLERWPIFSRRSPACSGSTEFTGQFLEPIFLWNHQPLIYFPFDFPSTIYVFAPCSILCRRDGMKEMRIERDIVSSRWKNLLRTIIFFLFSNDSPSYGN